MATAAEIAAFRLLINEPNDVAPWTDAAINDFLDQYLNADGSVDLDWAASHVWTEKASSTVGLVDMTENGSTRKLSDIHKNMLSMAEMFRARSPRASAEDASSRPRTRPIVRP